MGIREDICAPVAACVGGQWNCSQAEQFFLGEKRAFLGGQSQMTIRLKSGWMALFTKFQTCDRPKTLQDVRVRCYFPSHLVCRGKVLH